MEKVTVDLDSLDSALMHLAGRSANAVIKGLLRSLDETPKCSAETSRLGERTEEARRLRVMREFFEACGYATQAESIPGFKGDRLKVFGMECIPASDEAETETHYFFSDWLGKRRAVECAAREAMRLGFVGFLAMKVAGTELYRCGVSTDKCAWTYGPDTELEGESAVVAVTRAIKNQSK